MDFIRFFPLSVQLVTQPTGLWETIIFAFEKVIPSYAWAIIVFTLLLKLVLSPMDYYNKSFARKNTRMQAILKPEMDALQQKFGNDKDMMNQKTMELYKKHNFNVVGSCFIMLGNLVLTFVIFITLFNGLNSIARFKIEEQYTELKAEYEQTMVLTSSQEAAEAAVLVKYNEISNKYSWLWIKNVWQSDNPFTSSVLTFDQYNNIVKMDAALVDAERAVYDAVMSPLREEVGGPNGYLIIVFLAAALSYFSQKFSQATFKRNENGKWVFVNTKTESPQQGATKMMAWMLPILMGYITFTFNAVFGLYVTASALFGLVTTPFFNALIDKLDNKKQDKQIESVKPTYSR